MHDIKERLSLFWLFALLNYLYADVIGLWDIIGTPNFHVHLPPWALMGSAVLMEIPIAMIVASRLLPFRANRLGHLVYSAAQLKTLQEIITLIVFGVFSVTFLGEAIRWNHIAAFGCLVAAAFFSFTKWT